MVSHTSLGVRGSDRCSHARLGRWDLWEARQTAPVSTWAGGTTPPASLSDPHTLPGALSYPPLGALFLLWARGRQAPGSFSTTCQHLGLFARSPYNEVSEVRRGGEVSEEMAEERWRPWGLENCWTAAPNHGWWCAGARDPGVAGGVQDSLGIC